MFVSLGARLADLLEDNFLTALAFSDKAKISSSVVSKWIRGETSAKLKNLLKAAAFFNCSVDYLCGRTDFYGKFGSAAPTFPARLFSLIEQSGETQNAIFKKLGMNTHALYDWKNGSEPLSVNLITIAGYFKVSIDYLIGIENF